MRRLRRACCAQPASRAATFVSDVKERGRTPALGQSVLFRDEANTVVFLDRKAKGAGKRYVSFFQRHRIG